MLYCRVISLENLIFLFPCLILIGENLPVAYGIAKPQSCQELLSTGTTQNGEYKIWINGIIPKIVYCNMEIDGGGWIVIQRRVDTSTSFSRGWNEFKNGFGSLSHNFWLGLDSMHNLTKMGAELRVDVADTFGNKGFANYSNFMIGNESGNYALDISGYSGTAGDSLTFHNGMMFSTKDQDNDIHKEWHCAVFFKGAWWYKNCHASNLNGLFPSEGGGTYMTWYTLNEDVNTINYSEMKVRLKANECRTGQHQCSLNASCTNTIESYTCRCNSGFSGDGRSCTDIDECTTGQHQCSLNASCTNTNGSYICRCNSGFSGDGRTCTDIDECTTGQHQCSLNASCTNTNGSYICRCNSGFSGDGRTCTDIDECATGQHQCSLNASCTNTIGSYTCRCKLGYFGNGTSCGGGSNRMVCNETSMAIYLDNRTQLYNGSSITLNDTSCTAKQYPLNNEFGLVTAYDKCGTTRTETSTHIVYENQVTWTFGNTPSTLVKSTGKKIKFSCLLERNKNTSTIHLEPVKTFITAREVSFGTFTVSLSMYQENTFTTLQSIFPAAVNFDQRLYFEVQVGTNDINLVLLIEKCSATPTANKNHASSYDLIKDRCASDTTVQFISATPHKMRFSYMSFKFYGYPQVYLYCQIFLCHRQSSDSRCLSGCQGNNIKRARRSLLLESEEIGLRSLRRRDNEEQEVKNYPPSKAYRLNIGPFVESKDTPTDSGKKRDVKSSFTYEHGMILLNAILAITLGFFVAKAMVKKTRRRKEKQQDGFEKKQDNLNQVF